MVTTIADTLGWLLSRSTLPRARATGVTRIIQVLFRSTRAATLGAALVYGLPTIIGYGLLIWMRAGDLTATGNALLFIFIGACWSFVGPMAVWRYELIVAPEFLRRSVITIQHQQDADNLAGLLLTKLTSTISSRVILAVWVGLVTAGCIKVMGFERNLGLFGPTDPLWWLFFLGVVLHSYYTGLFFLIVQRTISATRALASFAINLNPYHEDARGGMGFIGHFSVRTGLMFASGIAFIPTLIYIVLTSREQGSYLVICSIIIYTIGILFAFFVPVVFMWKSIATQKRLLITRVTKELEHAGRLSLENPSAESLSKFQALRMLRDDLLGISALPISSKSAIVGVVTSSFPSLVITALKVYFDIPLG